MAETGMRSSKGAMRRNSVTGGGEGIGFFISGDLIIFLWSKNDNNTLEIALQSVAKFKGCGSPNDQPRNWNKSNK